MAQITNIQNLKTMINENGEDTITKKNIEKCLLKAEDDILNGRVRDARTVFKEWKEKYFI